MAPHSKHLQTEHLVYCKYYKEKCFTMGKNCHSHVTARLLLFSMKHV